MSLEEEETERRIHMQRRTPGEDTGAQREGGLVTMEADTGAMQLAAKDYQGLLVTSRG